MKELLIIPLLITLGCSIKTEPSPILIDLIAFQTALNDQYTNGGMDVDTYNLIQSWIGDGIRVIQVNPNKWEGQARLKFNMIRSLCGPYDDLTRIANKFNDTYF